MKRKTTRKPIVIGVSPIDGNIFAGTLLDKMTWSGNKHDVTIQALYAVADHISMCTDDGVMELRRNGVPEFEITVKDLR